MIMEPDCKKCIHFKWHSFTTGACPEAWCRHPIVPDQTRRWDVEGPKNHFRTVTEPHTAGIEVVKMRTDRQCGPEGKLYEPADL